ncbi:Exostosin-like family protein, glycosyltransferase family 47 protein [Rhodotorula toruloides NP11]|nr:Exostosin-like family protein, glycosyltransferase family 47 protein [Rhodotorula toruloides NP11]EMS24966.1 Exostosin-like family protein, glycosyltransferase family 47 protein [Rhodotorula toruloides NP11]
MPKYSRTDRPPPPASLSLLVRSLRTRRRSWILLLAGLLALVVYGRIGTRNTTLSAHGASELERRGVRFDRERDEDETVATRSQQAHLQAQDLRVQPPSFAPTRPEDRLAMPLVGVQLGAPPTPATRQASVVRAPFARPPPPLALHVEPGRGRLLLRSALPGLLPLRLLGQAGWTKTERCNVDEGYIQPVMRHVRETMPYWNRSAGADHLIPHPMHYVDGYYTETSRAAMNGSSYLVTVGDVRPAPYGSHFRFYRDIVLPSSTHLLNSYYVNPLDYVDEDGHPLREPRGAADPRRKTQAVPTGVEIFQPSPHEAGAWRRRPSFRSLASKLVGGRGIDRDRRTTLAIFRGGVGTATDGERYALGIRSLFFPSDGNASTPPFSSAIHPGFSSLPGFDIAEQSENDDYACRLARSKFGLAPPGYTLDTTRIYEYLAFGVVPVFIGSGPTAGQVMPFANDVDWSSFSISIPRDRAHETPHILAQVSDDEYERLRRKVWEVGRMVVLEGREGNVWKLIARQLCRMKRLGIAAGPEIVNN